MSMTHVHFHGGPYAGEQHLVLDPLQSSYQIPRKASDMDVRRALRTNQIPTLLVVDESGKYVQDPDSAGGRCYDWRPTDG